LFSKAAVVTFGGAYAVLPYVAQQAVDHYGWVQPGQMMDGLGLAETTPGPLIMVTQFVGFMGGWVQHGGMNRIVTATLGALITTWATFTPCFLWIFVGGPHIEQLRGNERLTTTLSAVTAAIVGVVMNLAVWFGIHVLLPGNGTFDWFALALGAIAFIAMMKWKWDVIALSSEADYSVLSTVSSCWGTDAEMHLKAAIVCASLAATAMASRAPLRLTRDVRPLSARRTHTNRVEIAQVVEHKARTEHRPRGEEQDVCLLEWREVLPEGREGGERVQQEHGAVGEALCKPEHEREEQQQLRPAQRECHRFTDTRHPIEMLEHRDGMFRTNEFVDRPDQHDEKDGES
jgi:chromate transport protein ChrA